MPPETVLVPAAPSPNDNESKDALQSVVDDNMRTDVLGPNFCRVLKDHTPASVAIVELMAKEIGKDPAVKQALKGVIDERNNESKMRWVDRLVGIAGTIVLALLIWGIEELIKKPS